MKNLPAKTLSKSYNELYAAGFTFQTLNEYEISFCHVVTEICPGLTERTNSAHLRIIFLLLFSVLFLCISIITLFSFNSLKNCAKNCFGLVNEIHHVTALEWINSGNSTFLF
jgi:hypothetical protein